MELAENKTDQHEESECVPMQVFTRWMVFPNMPELSDEAYKRLLAPYDLAPFNYTDSLAGGGLIPIVLLSDESIPKDVLSEPIINAIYVYSGCSELNEFHPVGNIDFVGNMDLHPSGGVHLRGRPTPDFEKINLISLMVDIKLVDPCFVSPTAPVFLADKLALCSGRLPVV